ncbi:MAG TPA: helix-turn-helix domain-containing protein [Ktedonobacterales bacterium]|nr:helix-turn-helix domain-containing protein [Ktedonobacterales bacterium]
MSMVFESRVSDSPLVERVWRSSSESAGPFISMALNRMQVVIWDEGGKTYFTVRGPETKATLAHCPVHAEFVGIVLKCGAFMPHLPLGNLIDGAVTLPEATSESFWLHGSAWQFPTYDNADTFIERLADDGALGFDPAVEAKLQGRPSDLSPRSAQRRFLRATGLTHSAVRQIERARYATVLLRQGASIFDAVFQAGYFDQPHLTRALRHFIGQTPAQITGNGATKQLSFLYKTSPVL